MEMIINKLFITSGVLLLVSLAAETATGPYHTPIHLFFSRSTVVLGVVTTVLLLTAVWMV